MKSYSSKEIIKELKKDGWYEKAITGSHHIFFHDIKKGIVVIPHPRKDLPVGTVKAIEKQAKINLRKE